MYDDDSLMSLMAYMESGRLMCVSSTFEKSSSRPLVTSWFYACAFGENMTIFLKPWNADVSEVASSLNYYPWTELPYSNSYYYYYCY